MINIQILKPNRKKIVLFILIFIAIEIVLYFMVNVCAFSCPMPPAPCYTKCLLNPQYFISTTLVNIIISYLISCFFLKEKINHSS